jgi:peptidyl-tRNA hydrolase, PTH1 family
LETEVEIKLVVGLGNPGPQYENTRHNVGFWLINAIAEKFNGSLKLETKFKGFFGVATVLNHECKLLMPTTFMNLSGEAVSRVVNFYKIPIESILIIHDELDFPPGIARLKKGGSANGHNGVQNIIDQLGNNNFWRLRLGIGKPFFKDAMDDYVTNAPNKTEKKEIYNAIEQAINIIPDLVLGNFVKATQTLHATK